MYVSFWKISQLKKERKKKTVWKFTDLTSWVQNKTFICWQRYLQNCASNIYPIIHVFHSSSISKAEKRLSRDQKYSAMSKDTPNVQLPYIPRYGFRVSCARGASVLLSNKIWSNREQRGRGVQPEAYSFPPHYFWIIISFHRKFELCLIILPMNPT